MMKKFKATAAPTTIYQTRHMPVELLNRMKRLLVGQRNPNLNSIEKIVNKALAIGMMILEEKAAITLPTSQAIKLVGRDVTNQETFHVQ